MKANVITLSWTVLFCLLFLVHRGAAQFVEVTTELEIDGWSHWFRQDENNSSRRRGEATNSVFTKSWQMRCVVGTNTWMIEHDLIVRNAKLTYWFTGSNIIERELATQATSEEEIKRSLQTSGVRLSRRRIGDQDTAVYQTVDGNPGRPPGSGDLLDFQGIITWLAYCSGPALKREGRRIPLPDNHWKLHFHSTGDFSDKTICFEDGFGLPKRIELFTKQGQMILQYQVRQSTNVLGWNFPSEFYLVQYERRGPRTNSFEVDFTAKGRVTAIGVGTEPRIPVEILNAVGE